MMRCYILFAAGLVSRACDAVFNQGRGQSLDSRRLNDGGWLEDKGPNEQCESFTILP